MILEQYYLGCLAQASYLVGDAESGVAAVVDPRRDIDLYIEEAKKFGVEIKHVLLTHFHADFVSGHLELRNRTGADIRLGKTAAPEFPFVPMGDGDVLELGKVRLEVLETPGHTPESICVKVVDTARDPRQPHAVLTGDTLFIGDVGRPDLLASMGVTAEELAGNLYDSTRNKLMTLPDETLVYPGHGAGSMCGKNLSSETVSTIGEQKQLNYALQPMSRDEFIHLVSQDQPKTPAYFSHDAVFNRQERITLDESMKKAMQPLDAKAVLGLLKRGAVLLDARPASRYATRFVKSSINIGLEGSYAIWAGTVLDRHTPVVVLAEPGMEEEAIVRLGRIGFDNVAGYAKEGIETFSGTPEVIDAVPRLDAPELARKAGEVLVLDVRNPREYDEQHLQGSQLVPLNELRERVSEISRDREVVVYCRSGYRSSIAASLLRREGFTGVSDMAGGILAWEEAGLVIEEGVATF